MEPNTQLTYDNVSELCASFTQYNSSCKQLFPNREWPWGCIVCHAGHDNRLKPVLPYERYRIIVTYRSIFFCVEVISFTQVLGKQRNTLFFDKIEVEISLRATAESISYHTSLLRHWKSNGKSWGNTYRIWDSLTSETKPQKQSYQQLSHSNVRKWVFPRHMHAFLHWPFIKSACFRTKRTSDEV